MATMPLDTAIAVAVMAFAWLTGCGLLALTTVDVVFDVMATRPRWRSPLALRKVGGLWFWRVGRLGGSVYVAARGNR